MKDKVLTRPGNIVNDVELETCGVDCKHCHPPFQYWQQNNADGFSEGTVRVRRSDKGKPVLVYSYDDWTYDMEKLITRENVIPIRCCPMCGRYLKND